MFGRKEYSRQYYIKNKDKMMAYRAKNKIKIKEYMKEYGKQYRADNKEEIKKRNKRYCKNNPEKVKEYMRRYQKKHKKELKEYREGWRKDNKGYTNNKRRINLKHNLNHKISGQIYKSLRRNKNGWHWEELVKYTLEDLIKRLKKTMPIGYTWQDFLDGKLHIDHKIPISAHNFSHFNHTDFQRCWALKNLRLLPARENLSKNNKLSGPFQPALKI